MRYTNVRTEMWTDSEFARLDIPGKLLYAYLLTSPFGNIAGYYKLPLPYLKDSLCKSEINGWDTVTDEEDMSIFKDKIVPQLLNEDKLWKYDEETGMLLIPTYLKHNKVISPPQVAALVKAVEYLPKSKLIVDFLFAVQKYSRKEAIEKMDKATLVYARELCKGRNDNKAFIVHGIISEVL